jgi:c-di-GMP-binding flagellar brake protein YcgR
MESSHKLSINQKIDVIDNNSTYKSKIQDINDDYIMIDVPYASSSYLLMHTGKVIEFYAAFENDVIKYKSVILSRKKEQNVYLAVLTVPEMVGKVQRRDYFRLPISLEVSYNVLTGTKNNYNLDNIPEAFLKSLKKAATIDLSGGGVKIITDKYIKHNSKVLIILNLSKEIKIICNTIRCDYNSINKNYRTALSFMNIDERTRDVIIKFVFEKSREQTKLLR